MQSSLNGFESGLDEHCHCHYILASAAYISFYAYIQSARNVFHRHIQSFVSVDRSGCRN